ncbi:hypothetical protein [Lentibacillus amyloliquefaciens]|uniref:Cpl-7 lysozyme C-terminal domain-containing protein n=1 Tax=Lentibacillus amyloliquefaciens TaxID=1472767 RepID=A0A0U4G3F0_9BACI|nr:hypothetical protein [Lentibacillus amyloliquefaciens]ALX47130.1 hypothetical protein AOX59_00035 [Lentibacillus amyloliquefaciens]
MDYKGGSTYTPNHQEKSHTVSNNVDWVGTDDKGKELIITGSYVNYYDTQRWSNPTGAKKRGYKWEIDNLYKVNGSLQYRVQDENNDLYFTTGRSDLVKVGGEYTKDESSGGSNPAPKSGEGIVDYMNRIGMDSSYSNRSDLAAQYGINGYQGTASQNMQLLDYISGSGSGSGKSISQMANEIIRGEHGSGHANRRQSLGISKSQYEKVRKEVNKRL